MEKINLEDYRCQCGKLLFRGIVVLSLVEIKCKRCAQITSFGELNKTKRPFGFLILVDYQGTIKDLCQGAELTLGYKKEDLVDSSIDRVCPLIHDYIIKNKNQKETHHEIENNSFLVEGGRTLDAKTYCVAPKESVEFLGYYIFSMLKRI